MLSIGMSIDMSYYVLCCSYTGSSDVTLMEDIYLATWCRCPVYFMGLLLGYYFYKTDSNITMPKVWFTLIKSSTRKKLKCHFS